MSTGAGVAIAVKKARDHIMATLRDAGATRSKDAVKLDVENKIERSQLAHLIRREVIKDAGGGRLWLDEHAYAEYRAKSRHAVMIAMLVVAGCLIILACALFAMSRS